VEENPEVASVMSTTPPSISMMSPPRMATSMPIRLEMSEPMTAIRTATVYQAEKSTAAELLR
jgi:hypothetical protein